MGANSYRRDRKCGDHIQLKRSLAMFTCALEGLSQSIVRLAGRQICRFAVCGETESLPHDP